MKKIWICVGVFFLAFTLNSIQSTVVCASAQEDAYAGFLAQGDAAYDAFDNQGALKNYLLAYEADSTRCEPIWKISRAYVDLGEQAKDDAQKDLYKKAEVMARKAVARCPKDAEGHFHLAVAVGRVALKEGGKTKVSLSKEVKEEAIKALELDPSHDGAHHVLARWHREVANLSGALKFFAKVLYGGLPPASNEKAIEHFQKSIQIKPDHINHHLELGITYEQLKNWDLALQEYNKVLTLPIKDADDEAHKKEAKERIAKVQKEKK